MDARENTGGWPTLNDVSTPEGGGWPTLNRFFTPEGAPLKRFLGFARDFGSGLKRPLSVSTWVAAFSVCQRTANGFVSGHAFRRAACDVIDWRL